MTPLHWHNLNVQIQASGEFIYTPSPQNVFSLRRQKRGCCYYIENVQIFLPLSGVKLFAKFHLCAVQAGQGTGLTQRFKFSFSLDTEEEAAGLLGWKSWESTPMLGRVASLQSKSGKIKWQMCNTDNLVHKRLSEMLLFSAKSTKLHIPLLSRLCRFQWQLYGLL